MDFRFGQKINHKLEIRHQLAKIINSRLFQCVSVIQKSLCYICVLLEFLIEGYVYVCVCPNCNMIKCVFVFCEIVTALIKS